MFYTIIWLIACWESPGAIWGVEENNAIAQKSAITLAHCITASTNDWTCILFGNCAIGYGLHYYWCTVEAKGVAYRNASKSTGYHLLSSQPRKSKCLARKCNFQPWKELHLILNCHINRFWVFCECCTSILVDTVLDTVLVSEQQRAGCNSQLPPSRESWLSWLQHPHPTPRAPTHPP